MARSYALKEWASTCEALEAGRQVLVLRKGGIGEKRFEIPHRAFFLFPTYLHQRPELLVPEARETYRQALGRAAEPDELDLPVWCQVHAAHPITDPADLDRVAHLHILAPDYAAERLRWRRTQPLWAIVLRAFRPLAPPRIAVLPEHGGCVSWIELPEGVVPGPMEPALADGAFAAAAREVEGALSVTAG